MKTVKLIFNSNKILSPILLLSIIINFLVLFSQDINAEDNFNKFRFYKNKYKVECANEKITDNIGKGNDSLYGTRNMRTILYGVAYRGGANNFYHKLNKRDNHNPLPEDGLENLCNQGFSTAVYLYGTNFSESKKQFDMLKKEDEYCS